MIPLVCGDPTDKPASYSRFVLPFSYQLVSCDQKEFSHFYKSAAPIDIGRKNYLTVETAAVLFERARWFELASRTPLPDFPIHRLSKTFTVHIHTPRLVLFEWPTNLQRTQREKYGDPLCIGFLIVDVSFLSGRETPDMDDLLEFNEKFRFWYRPYEGHEEHYKSVLAKCPLDIHRPGQVVGEGDQPAIYFDRWASLLEIPIQDELGKTLWLFPESWKQLARAWVSGNRSDLWESGWVVYTDNRAFVWTCAIIDGGGKKLQEVLSPPSDDFLPNAEASTFGHWIKLLNVDTPKENTKATHQSTQFERDWAEKRTYHRWEELGTFYGFNYHCGAMLGPPLGKQKPEPEIWKHFGKMYFDQTLLLLYLRVGSFHFSRRLGRISAKAQDENEKSEAREEWQREFQKLRWSFALFTNLYEFPLLSNQQQGVEMYALARKYMDVEELFREIQEEIRSSHDYLAFQAGQEQTEITTLLTVVATLGLAVGLAIGFWGMNIVTTPSPTPPSSLSTQIGWFFVTLFIFWTFILLFIRRSKRIAKVFHRLANCSLEHDRQGEGSARKEHHL